MQSVYQPFLAQVLCTVAMALMLGREAHAFDLHLKIVLICHFFRLQTLVMNQSSLNLRNPMLPVSMVMGQSVSAGRLDDPKGKYQIKCLQPGRTDWKLKRYHAVPVKALDHDRCTPLQSTGSLSLERFQPWSSTRLAPSQRCCHASPWKLQHVAHAP